MIARHIILLFLILVCTSASEAQQKNESGNLIVLKEYFEAFNRHDINSLMTYISEDFKMYSITDTTRLDISGKKGLRQWLHNYFAELPKVSSQYDTLNSSGRWISFTETASWGQGKSASSLAVYEIIDNKIRRVWYYY